MSKKVLSFLSLCLLVPTLISFAANYGKISGKIIDRQTNEPLVGANIMVQGTTLGAVSDPEGHFVILQVPPGVYKVQAKILGYQPMIIENVQVATNRIAVVNFSMTQTTLTTESVEVIGVRPVIEKDITATSRNVNEKDIAVLPTTTVNDVLVIQPGVISSGGLHVRGGRSGEVTYYLDGIPMVEPLFSDINSTEVINRDAISEMQVISGTYSAEYGNSMSGIINITTKEGGSKYNYNLNAKRSNIGLETASNDYNRNVLRATFSGPIPILKKTSFFVTGSYDDRESYLPWGYRWEKNVFAKLTDRHLNNLKFNLAVNVSKGKRKNYSHAYKYIPEMYWYEPNTSSQMIQFGFTHTLSPKLYYSLNAYANKFHYDSGDYDYHDLKYDYRRDANKEFYLLSYVSTYEEDDQQTQGLKGEILWQVNNYNEVKGGFEYRRHRLDRFYINDPYYDDHRFEKYVRKPSEAAIFLQDKINFSSIILSAGLRWDMTEPNSYYWKDPYDADLGRDSAFVKSSSYSQLSPRLGISYPVSDKTVFHFGYGHYFQRPEYQFMYTSISDRNYVQNLIMNLRSGEGRFGNPDLKPEKTIAYEFGLSHQLMTNYLLNVTVYSKKITNLVGTRTYFALSEPEIWETYTMHINEDFAYNNGIELQLRKMRGRYLTGEINYTYAVAEGSSSAPLERVGIEEANRSTLKFFPLDFDQRHTVNAYLTFSVPKAAGPSVAGVHFLQRFTATLLFQYGSGLPYTKGIRGATEPYELNNMRLPENWTFDLKLYRDISLGDIRLTPYFEVYNLTNRKNVVYVDPMTGKPDYIEGRTKEWAANPLNWGAPRLLYLGMEINL